MRTSLARKVPLSKGWARKISLPPNGFLLQDSEGTNSIVLEKQCEFGIVQVISFVETCFRSSLLRNRNESSRKEKRAQFFFSIYNLKLKVLPVGVCGVCSSSLGQLIVEKLFFTPNSLSCSHEDDIALSQLDASYCGPHLTQRFLAEALVGKFSQQKDSLLYPESNQLFFSSDKESSVFHSFNHLPVHSVGEDVTEAATHLLEFYGIDDFLASYVESAVREKKSHERSKWNECLHFLFTRK